MMRFSGALARIAGLLLCGSALADTGPCTIERVAGTSDASRFNGVLATEAELLTPIDMALGPDGLLYILDSASETIVRVNADGKTEVVAGNGDRGSGGDGGPARQASFLESRQIRFGPDGSLYLLEGPFLEKRIRRIAPDGTIETFVQLGQPGKYGLGDTADEMGLLGINSFDVGPDGSLYLSSGALHRIFRVAPDRTASVVAGAGDAVADNGAYSGDGGPAVDAELDRPDRVAVAPDGTVYFTDGRISNERIRRILPGGTIETYMTRGGGATVGALRTDTSYLRSLGDLSVDAEGRLYWLDSDLEGRAIKRVGLDDRIELVWRTGEIEFIGQPLHVDGETYLISVPQILRAGNEAGVATTLAGVPRSEAGYGDRGAALDAAFISPRSLAVGSQDELYNLDLPGGRITTIRDGVLERITSTMGQVNDIAVGPDGSLYLNDGATVRRVYVNGDSELFAGDGKACPDPSAFQVDETCGDGGPATEAQLGIVQELEADELGNVYILAAENRVGGDWVRRVRPDGTIETVSRKLSPGILDETARSIAIQNGDELLLLSRNGLSQIGADDERVPLEPPTRTPFGAGKIAGSPTGDIYIAGEGIWRRTPEGAVSQLLPFRRSDLDLGDGNAPREATTGPLIGDLATDSNGDLYFTDPINAVIRRINAPRDCPEVDRPQIAAVANAGFFPGGFAPGAIVTIFGAGLGPEVGIVGAPGPEGRFPTELDGVRVMIDGLEAVVLYASDSQVNAIIPSSIDVLGRYRHGGGAPFFSTSARSDLSVIRNGIDSDPMRISMQPASPAFLLLANEQAAAINQNGSVNGASSPAARGSVIALYMSGGGVMSPALEDGAVVGDVFPQVIEKAVVLVDGREVEALYAGGAPGLVNGVMQLNFRVPDSLTQSGRIEIEVKVGLDRSARSAYLHVE